MERIIIIPDVHGRTFWKDAIKDIDDTDKVIFLGDYVDPYPFEKITPDEALSNFKEILEFKKNRYENTIMLIGNHDCGYLFSMTSCRVDRKNFSELKSLFEDNLDMFDQNYVLERDGKKYLFSHGVVKNDWIDNYRWLLFNEGKINSVDEMCNDLNNIFHNDSTIFIRAFDIVSFYRGGYNDCGSPVWSDIKEHITSGYEIEGYYQVVGHTQLMLKPYITDYVACLDCRRAFELKNNEFIPITDESTIYI